MLDMKIGNEGHSAGGFGSLDREFQIFHDLYISKAAHSIETSIASQPFETLSVAPIMLRHRGKRRSILKSRLSEPPYAISECTDTKNCGLRI